MDQVKEELDILQNDFEETDKEADQLKALKDEAEKRIDELENEVERVNHALRTIADKVRSF